MSPMLGFTILFIAWVIAAAVYSVSATEVRRLLALVLYAGFILLSVLGVVREAMG